MDLCRGEKTWRVVYLDSIHNCEANKLLTHNHWAAIALNSNSGIDMWKCVPLNILLYKSFLGFMTWEANLHPWTSSPEPMAKHSGVNLDASSFGASSCDVRWAKSSVLDCGEQLAISASVWLGAKKRIKLKMIIQCLSTQPLSHFCSYAFSSLCSCPCKEYEHAVGEQHEQTLDNFLSLIPKLVRVLFV